VAGSLNIEGLTSTVCLTALSTGLSRRTKLLKRHVASQMVIEFVTGGKLRFARYGKEMNFEGF